MICNCTIHSLEAAALLADHVDFGSHRIARVALELLAACRPTLLLGIVLRHLLVACEAGHFFRNCTCRESIFRSCICRGTILRICICRAIFSCSELLGAMACCHEPLHANAPLTGAGRREHLSKRLCHWINVNSNTTAMQRFEGTEHRPIEQQASGNSKCAHMQLNQGLVCEPDLQTSRIGV